MFRLPISLIAFTSLIFAGGDFTKAQMVELTELISKNYVTEKETKDFFVSLHAGLGLMSAESDVPNPIYMVDSQKNAFDIDFEVGYYPYKNIWFGLGASKGFSDVYDDTNLYLSLNYDFYDDDRYTLYCGVVGAKNFFEWDDVPNRNLTYSVIDKKGDSISAGGQIGLRYALDDDFSLDFRYQYLKYKENTNIDNYSLNYQNKNNFIIGVRYAF